MLQEEERGVHRTRNESKSQKQSADVYGTTMGTTKDLSSKNG